MNCRRHLMTSLLIVFGCFVIADQAVAQVGSQYQGSYGIARGKINQYQTGGIYNSGGPVSPYYTILRNANAYANAYAIIRRTADSQRGVIDNRRAMANRVQPQFLSTSNSPPALSPPVYRGTTGHASQFLMYDFRPRR